MRGALVVLILCLPMELPAQAPGRLPSKTDEPRAVLMRQAAELIREGNIAGAELVCENLLQIHPGDIEALVTRGHVRSWQRKFDAAQTDFREVLRLDPNNVSARNGLGYTYAWMGAYRTAEEEFRQVLLKQPGQVEAEKGLAYLALWKGDEKEAVRRFSALLSQAPNDAEAEVGLGQAQLAAGQKKAARTAFQRALRIDPNRRDAKLGLEASRSTLPVLELTAWGGRTSFGSGGAVANGLASQRIGSETGFRFAEAAVWPAHNIRLHAQYDNGLSIDNPALAHGSQGVPTYYAGGLVNWRRRHMTRVEGGWRTLPGQIGQKLVRAEHVVLLPGNYTFKSGGWVGPRQDKRTEWLSYTGLGVPVRKGIRLEPTYFYSRSGLPNERQWRLLLAGTYSLESGWSFGGGFAGGRAFVGPQRDGQGVRDAYFNLSTPRAGPVRGHLLVRNETTGRANAITVAALGLSVRFGR